MQAFTSAPICHEARRRFFHGRVRCNPCNNGQPCAIHTIRNLDGFKTLQSVAYMGPLVRGLQPNANIQDRLVDW